mgnify:CR=1 FL=1
MGGRTKLKRAGFLRGPLDGRRELLPPTRAEGSMIVYTPSGATFRMTIPLGIHLKE